MAASFETRGPSMVCCGVDAIEVPSGWAGERTIEGWGTEGNIPLEMMMESAGLVVSSRDWIKDSGGFDVDESSKYFCCECAGYCACLCC